MYTRSRSRPRSMARKRRSCRWYSHKASLIFRGAGTAETREGKCRRQVTGQICVFLYPRSFYANAGKVFILNGGDDGTRTRGFCRNRAVTLSTYNNLQGYQGLPSQVLVITLKPTESRVEVRVEFTPSWFSRTCKIKPFPKVKLQEVKIREIAR